MSTSPPSTSPCSPSQLPQSTLTPIKPSNSNGLTTSSRTNSIKRSPHLRNGTRTSPNLNSSPSKFNNLNNDDHFVSNENDFIVDSISGGANGELEKCSREVLITILTRQSIEFNAIREKLDLLEESKSIESKENLGLSRNIEMANTRIDQLLNDQYRMEEELAGRIEVLDKLRTTVKESEREKRDSEKRYREQSESFDAERKAWLDQEAHYNLRISNLSSAPRKARISDLPSKLVRRESDPDFDPITDFVPAPLTPNSVGGTPNSSTTRTFFPNSPSSASLSSSNGPSANELILSEQLNSLTTAHTSLTLTLRALQGELSEIKRVYQDVQEQNESYEIMLGERTLNGEIRGSEILRRSWTQDSEGDGSSIIGVGGLESVGEDSGELSDRERDEFSRGGLSDEEFQFQEPRESSQSPSGRRRRRPAPPTTRKSGGLDLGAELEAAQMGDKEDEAPTVLVSTAKKSKHKKEVSSAEDLKAEIKSLKEANKALTLYVSKIVEKICSQEGFEKVLATDYLAPTTPKMADYSPIISDNGLPATSTNPSNSPIASTSSPRNHSTPTTRTAASTASPPPPSSPPVTASNQKDRSRKTLSLGWDSVSSVFASALSRAPVVASPPPLAAPAGFKPFMLNTASNNEVSTSTLHTTTSSAIAAPTIKKHETTEDEDDKKERERLRAEMTLHGFIDPAWSTESTSSPSSNLSVVNSGSRLSPLLGSPNISSSASNTSTSTNESSPALNFRRINTPSPTFSSTGSPSSTSSAHQSPNLDSNFTENKPRRARPLSIARASRTSIPIGTVNESFGLGIGSSDLSTTSASGSSTKSTPTTSPNFSSIGLPPVKPEGEDVDGWSKKLKRMSLGTWGVPSVTVEK